MTQSYKKLENLFMSRTDALCEDNLPDACACNECPVQMMCHVLCSIEPTDEVPDEWMRQFNLI